MRYCDIYYKIVTTRFCFCFVLFPFLWTRSYVGFPHAHIYIRTCSSHTRTVDTLNAHAVHTHEHELTPYTHAPAFLHTCTCLPPHPCTQCKQTSFIRSQHQPLLLVILYLMKVTTVSPKRHTETILSKTGELGLWKVLSYQPSQDH